jgi:hypothetical protein
VPAITGNANGERAAAAAAGLLAERRVHDVGATARSDWTRRAKRARTVLTGSVLGASRRSPRVWRVQLQALTSTRRSPQRSSIPVSRGAGSGAPLSSHRGDRHRRQARRRARRRPLSRSRLRPRVSFRITRFYATTDTDARLARRVGRRGHAISRARPRGGPRSHRSGHGRLATMDRRSGRTATPDQPFGAGA